MKPYMRAGAAPAPLVTLPALLWPITAYLLLFLSAFILLLDPGDSYDNQRWGALLLLATVAASGKATPATRSLRLPVVFMTLGLGSVAFSPRPIEALAVFSTHIGLLVLAWACAQVVMRGGSDVLRGWCFVALAAALLYGTLVALWLKFLIQSNQMNLTEAFLGFSNRRFFLQLTTLWLPCLVMLALDTMLPPRHRILGGIGAFIWSVLIWLNDGSGALYALGLGMGAAILLLGPRRLWPCIAATTGALLAGYLALQLVGPWLPSVSEAARAALNPGWSGRLELWQRALTAIAERPLLGWGPGTYSYFTDAANAHPHNMLLDWACGYGLLGLALVARLLWGAFDPLRMRKRLAELPAASQPYATALILAALSGLAHAGVSGVTVMPMPQILLSVTLGICAGLVGNVNAVQPSIARSSRLPRLLLASLILLSAAWSYSRSCALQESAASACRNTPAFWSQYPKAPGTMESS